MARYSWKRGKDYDGLARRAKTYALRYDGKELATAQESGRGSDLWFWYGDNVNTSHDPKPLAEVKADALAHFRAYQ